MHMEIETTSSDETLDTECYNVDLSKYKFVKRTPQRTFGKKNEIYVSSKSKVIVVVKKAQKILENLKKSKLYIHGLGIAIPKAIDVCLVLKQKYLNTLEFYVTTSTVPVVDDYIPTTDEGFEAISDVRYVSAIQIVIQCKDGLKVEDAYSMKQKGMESILK